MNRNILHLDLDTFFVSCERRLNSKLIGKPVIVGGTGDRGVGSAASYECRAYGVHSGMAMRMARQLCPHATYIRGNASVYTKFSKMVTEILQEQVPVLEKSSRCRHIVSFSSSKTTTVVHRAKDPITLDCPA